MLAKGLSSLLLCSLLFEPVRNSLYTLGNHVGGVGGVGGMTNQWDPRLCNTTSGRIGAYCFHDGIFMGLTPFALVVLLLWTLPLLLSVFSVALEKSTMHFGCSTHAMETAESLVTLGHPPVAASLLTNSFTLVWTACTCVWFCVPLAAYLSSPFYQKDICHVILGVAISAAMPLSWHLSFVALPMGEFARDLLGCRRDVVASCHKFVGWSTAIFVALHVGGEVIYLASQSSLIADLDVTANGENLLYVMGVVVFCVFVAHIVVVSLRHVPSVAAHFRFLHGRIASVLLLCATAHWWPFAFFLVPAMAMHGTSMASKHKGISPQVARKACALALGSALVANIIILFCVWALRQAVMRRSEAGLYAPFIFPPLSVMLGFFGGYIFAVVALHISSHCVVRA